MFAAFLRAGEADRPWNGILELDNADWQVEHFVVVDVYVYADSEFFGNVFVYQRAFHGFDAYVGNEAEVAAAFCYIIETLVIFVQSYQLFTF